MFLFTNFSSQPFFHKKKTFKVSWAELIRDNTFFVISFEKERSYSLTIGSLIVERFYPNVESSKESIFFTNVIIKKLLNKNKFYI